MMRFRVPSATDANFLSRLFASAIPERQFLPQELLAMQERIQRLQWTQLWGPDGETIVEVDGVPAARIWLAGGTETVRLVDLTVLPDFRGLGWGRRLVAGLCDAADAAGAGLQLTVHQDNAVAQALYESLGFQAAARTGDIYTAMTRPATPAPESP
jgi:ribosomal protein S18 acetylase RimI-like enzyme